MRMWNKRVIRLSGKGGRLGVVFQWLHFPAIGARGTVQHSPHMRPLRGPVGLCGGSASDTHHRLKNNEQFGESYSSCLCHVYMRSYQGEISKHDGKLM